MQVAHEYLEKGELQKAAEEFQKVAKGAQESPAGSTEAHIISCLLNAGACLVSLGEYEKGLSCLNSAAAVITARSPPNGPTEHREDGSSSNGPAESREDGKESLQILADVHFNSAIAYQALGDYDQAVQQYQVCLNIHENSGNPGTSADILNALAECCRETGQFDQEVSYLERAQVVCRELGESGREAVVCVRLARAHLRAGREGDCRQLLSTAKMISSRVSDKKILGSLYLECGLVHSSLGQHNQALQSFEQALPLVREAGKSDSQLQEASLLQNIGATYNKKQMYSESLVYHREAATMHGRLESHEAEIKCLCNLASAQSQLGDYTSASATLTTAEERARAVKNTDLQFQACESLGGCYYHTGRYPEAERAFNSALKLLDNTEGDTGTARERVMKKLSEVKEASRKSSEASPTAPTDIKKPPSHSSSKVGTCFHESTEEPAQENRVGSDTGEEGNSAVQSNHVLSTEEETAVQSDKDISAEEEGTEEGATVQATSAKAEDGTEEGNAAVQVKSAEGEEGNAAVQVKSAEGEEGNAAVQDLPVNGEEGTEESGTVQGTSTQEEGDAVSRSDTPQSQDSHERELQAYQEGLNSSHGSSEAPSHHLYDSSQRSEREQSSLLQGQGGINPPLSVTEGSLAIGANAREMYRVQQSRVEGGGKGKRRKTSCTTEIVRRDGQHQEEPDGLTEDDDTNGLLQSSLPSSHTVHSRTCTIL